MTHTNWPGMSGPALAAVLDRLAENLAQGRPTTAYQRDALAEAIERARESEAGQ